MQERQTWMEHLFKVRHCAKHFILISSKPHDSCLTEQLMNSILQEKKEESDLRSLCMLCAYITPFYIMDLSILGCGYPQGPGTNPLWILRDDCITQFEARLENKNTMIYSSKVQIISLYMRQKALHIWIQTPFAFCKYIQLIIRPHQINHPRKLTCPSMTSFYQAT